MQLSHGAQMAYFKKYTLLSYGKYLLPYFCHTDDRKYPDPFIHGKEERYPSFPRNNVRQSKAEPMIRMKQDNKYL